MRKEERKRKGAENEKERRERKGGEKEKERRDRERDWVFSVCGEERFTRAPGSYVRYQSLTALFSERIREV